MNEKILLVDDEPNVLQSLQRQLRTRYKVSTAESGAEALEIIKDHEPFAVIVSDMRMPGMDGIQFLRRVKDLSPDAVRIMLTGDADQQTAAEAVNSGQIFRFLTKPCPTAVLATSLALAVRQHNLITAEKELLNKTVKGSITVMAELLSLTNRTAFSSGYRIKSMVKDISMELELPGLWQYEVAAPMSQIGCITLPVEILHKLQLGQTLSTEEQQMYENHPKVGSQLIRKIPRMEKVAAMIEHQLRSYNCPETSDALDEEVSMGASILKATIDYDLLHQQNLGHQLILQHMWKEKERYNPKILELLEKQKPKNRRTTVRNLNLKDIVPGMIAVEDVFAKNSTLLIPKDQEITRPIIESLANFKKRIGIVEPIRVRITYGEEQVEPI